MTQTFNKGKVILDTLAQFQTLSTTGSITIGGVTITYDPNHYDYWVKESDTYTKAETDSLLANFVLSGDGAPTGNTAAQYFGQLYIDTTNNKTYQCISIDVLTPSYGWTQLLRGSDITYLTGTFVILATDWVSNVATVSLTGITPADTLNLSGATATDLTNIINADIFTEISSNTITLTAQTTPATDITFSYSVFGVH